MNYFIFFIIIISILIIIQIYYNTNIEKFCNNIIYNIISENSYNFNNSIDISSSDYKNILDDINSNNLTFNKFLNNTNTTLLIDPYINHFILNDYATELYCKPGYFFYLSKYKLNDNYCTWDLNNKTILYTCSTDYYFIMSIIYGYRLDINTINLIKININKLEDTDIKFDVLITYIIPDSNYKILLENLYLHAYGFKDIDINRIKLFYPFINIENNTHISSVFNNKLTNINIHNKSFTDLPFTTYYTSTFRFNKIIETFITNIKIPDDYLNPLYKCYGDDDNINKYACLSKFNYDNTLKSSNQTSWKKTCNNNDECPYYKKNTNYKNERGKCVDGYCELPIGIKRKGYIEFNDTNEFTPFCYGCSDDDFDCCNNQSNPDYAFENDYNDRITNSLSTIISSIHYKF